MAKASVKPESNKKKGRRLSLGFKWTAVVALGIFATFIVFSLILFGATRQILINEEKNTVRDTLSAVEQRLSPVASELTIASVVPRINGDVGPSSSSNNEFGSVAGGRDSNVYSDSVIQKISRSDINLTIYNLAGEVVFTSRNVKQPLKKTKGESVQQVNRKSFNGLIGDMPIVSSVNGKTTGYVQVTDGMAVFHATMRRVTNLFWILSVVAVLVSALIGYLLSRRFLKPIRSITDTIAVVNEEPQSNVRIPDPKRNDEMGDLIVEFNAMLDRIQRFIDQQSDFVQDVSHELRTPVAILEGHLQMLTRWGKDDPEVLDESLNASVQEVSRMKSLIQEMLDLTRADQVDVQFPNAVTDVNQTLGQVVDDFKMIHPDFIFNMDNDLTGSVYVRMYRNHLEQVLIILLDNAVKYSLKRKEVHVSAALDDDGVAIAVQDFGEGIPPEAKARVFNRFYRVDKARSREKGGNGLGLSIAQQLIESYHGTIQVDSALGHGSSFRVDLPVISPQEAQRLQAQTDAQQKKDETQDDDHISSNL